MKKDLYSPAGNRTPVSRVTGGDTHHYTTEEVGDNEWIVSGDITAIFRNNAITWNNIN